MQTVIDNPVFGPLWVIPGLFQQVAAYRNFALPGPQVARYRVPEYCADPSGNLSP